MHAGVGIGLLVGGAVAALVTAFVLRARAPAPVVTTVLVGCGVALAAGALLVQRHVSRTNWILTVVLLAFLVPAHVRVVLGRFGRRST